MNQLMKIFSLSLLLGVASGAGTLQLEIRPSFTGKVDVCLQVGPTVGPVQCDLHLPTVDVITGRKAIVSSQFNASWVPQFAVSIASRRADEVTTIDNYLISSERSGRWNSVEVPEEAQIAVRYRVVCKSGMTGMFCDEYLNYCASVSPCENKGICRNELRGVYSCECPRGFIGKNCQERSLCSTYDFCKNGGSCYDINQGTDIKCFCPPNFTGEFCEHPIEIEQTVIGSDPIVSQLTSDELTTREILLLFSVSAFLLLSAVVYIVRRLQIQKKKVAEDSFIAQCNANGKDICENRTFKNYIIKDLPTLPIPDIDFADKKKIDNNNVDDYAHRYTDAPSNQTVVLIDDDDIYEEIDDVTQKDSDKRREEEPVYAVPS